MIVLYEYGTQFFILNCSLSVQQYNTRVTPCPD